MSTDVSVWLSMAGKGSVCEPNRVPSGRRMGHPHGSGFMQPAGTGVTRDGYETSLARPPSNAGRFPPIDRSPTSTMNRTDNCPTSGREAAVVHETPEPDEVPLPGVMTVPPNDSPRRHEAERKSDGATSPRISGIWDRVSSPAVASVAGRTAGNSLTPIIRS